jgi:hypothetical protein
VIVRRKSARIDTMLATTETAEGRAARTVEFERADERDEPEQVFRPAADPKKV